MAKIKKKSRKKRRKEEAEKPDPFLNFGLKALDYTKNNLATVIFGGVLVMAAVAFALYWPTLKAQREERAATALYEAEQLLDTGSGMAGLQFMVAEPKKEDLEKAIEIYQKVIAEHSGTAAARRAMLLEGDAYMTLAEKANRQEAADYYAKAEESYNAAVSKAAAGERAYALSGLGSAREALNDFGGAADAYRRIVDDEGNPYRDTSALDLARALAKDNQIAQARDVLESFEEDFPSAPSTLKESAAAQLLLLPPPDRVADLDPDLKESPDDEPEAP